MLLFIYTYFFHFCRTEELYYTHIMANKDCDQQTTMFFFVCLIWIFLCFRFNWMRCCCGGRERARNIEYGVALYSVARICSNYRNRYTCACPRHFTCEKVKNMVCRWYGYVVCELKSTVESVESVDSGHATCNYVRVLCIQEHFFRRT